MTNAELFYFLGKCLSLGKNEENKQEVIRAVTGHEVDWEKFVALASNHLVLPSVYLRFKKQGILPFLPEELAGHLQIIYELNLQRNTKILAQIDKINRLFATAGIVPIYLKGAGNLLDRLYEDVGERMLGDIDLLVSEKEFLPAANLLKAEGYETHYPYFADELPRTKHYPRLVHPTELADVEVHRVPVELELSAHFNYSVIGPEKKYIETNPPCFVLSDRHKAILNFMHGFMNTEVKTSKSISFRNLVDLYFLSHRADVHAIFSGLPQYARQACVYADFMNYSMGLRKSQELAPQSQKFIRKHNSLQESIFFALINWAVRYLLSRFSGYFRLAVGSVLSKNIRKNVLRKLGDPTWYKLHLQSYYDSFRQIFGKR